MPRPEYSNDRDLSYSAWHRTLLNKCYAMNMDWIEVRFENNHPIIVAFIEEKDNRAQPLIGWKREVFINMAKALNVPAFVVYHNLCRRSDHKQLWQFRRVNLITNEESVLNESEYRKWIETL